MWLATVLGSTLFLVVVPIYCSNSTGTLPTVYTHPVSNCLTLLSVESVVDNWQSTFGFRSLPDFYELYLRACYLTTFELSPCKVLYDWLCAPNLQNYSHHFSPVWIRRIWVNISFSSHLCESGEFGSIYHCLLRLRFTNVNAVVWIIFIFCSFEVENKLLICAENSHQWNHMCEFLWIPLVNSHLKFTHPFSPCLRTVLHIGALLGACQSCIICLLQWS